MSHLPALAWRAVEGGSRKGSERNDGQPGASRGTESGLRPQDHLFLPVGGAHPLAWWGGVHPRRIADEWRA